MKQLLLCLLFGLLFLHPLHAQRIRPAAERFDQYLPLLQNKRIAIFANHTTVVNDSIHLVDVLKKKGVLISKIFAPEHGFRGKADAGEKVDNSIDPSTGVKIISLYGKKRKPASEDLQDVDVLVFDIQDVGTRFYTYISSLEEYIESAVAAGKPLIVLDRPNPNGFYIDGPVLEKPFRSFVGMQPVPVVYGMTIGEYAKMLVGEKWIDSSLHSKLAAFKMTVIPCDNYTHKSLYSLPVNPSPNLPDMAAIYWYPSTCFFEGTVLSEGRGTEHPFQIFGHPDLPKNLYKFTPVSREGAKEPKLKDKVCYGWTVAEAPEQVLKKVNGMLQLKFLQDAYRLFPQKDSFFLGKPNAAPTAYFFNKLAGNAELMAQIRSQQTESAIRKSWQPGINRFKTIRKKYLMYEDFE
ncbi:exo-beta-N-acetylmuramidase NamZ domain-containing protein [Flavihumibacter solisilvae]|uniref:DUF1343 domain-containing protein n=1 Tax=Flavihumibacter solisilvae TaxID=1349421 RepID=A0A0C1IS73_9BACT|nr:DUF1343 domain-containing protein [Flavihumibacter solisilvae]KIC93299.1 hypothetical protein OI18_18815 [Flavihumibacter solisilvae]